MNPVNLNSLGVNLDYVDNPLRFYLQKQDFVIMESATTLALSNKSAFIMALKFYRCAKIITTGRI